MTLAPQHTLTRGLAALILTASTLAACSADTEETVSSSGGCEGPDITVEPSTAAPGDTITVHGTAFRTDCYDHMVPGQTAGPAEPMPPFQLRLDDGTDVQDIALAEPDDEGVFDVAVTIPETVTAEEVRIIVPNLSDPTFPDSAEETVTIENAS